MSGLSVVGLGGSGASLDELLGKMRGGGGNNTTDTTASGGAHVSQHQHDELFPPAGTTTAVDQPSSKRKNGADSSKGATARNVNKVSLRTRVAQPSPEEAEEATRARKERIFSGQNAHKRNQAKHEEITPAEGEGSGNSRNTANDVELPSPSDTTDDDGSTEAEVPADNLGELLNLKVFRALTQKLSVERLTRVQQLSWKPMTLPGKDVLIRSETGSGKTLAYALPLINSLLSTAAMSSNSHADGGSSSNNEVNRKPLGRQDGTRIIVMAPTRELTEQVSRVIQTLATYAPFVVVGAIHGGENRHKEKARLRKGVTVLITTPGRLVDHLKATRSFDHAALENVVLDEADRLLDMGFEAAVREIMGILSPKKRVLVSATITRGVESLAHFALRNPIRVGETSDTFSVPESLRQHVTVTTPKLRLTTLLAFLRCQLDGGSRKIAVFVSTSDSAEFHYLLVSRLQNPYINGGRGGTVSQLKRPRDTEPTSGKSTKKLTQRANSHVLSGGAPENIDDSEVADDVDEDDSSAFLRNDNPFLSTNVFKLHGNMTQVDRSNVFHSFKTQTDTGVLFCTDVAARGLDMDHIDWIVHYDPPTDERCYVHRVGRTARIGNVGDSILFLQEQERGYADVLSKFVRAPLEERRPESFLYYLTKLDAKSNQYWVEASARLQRAACSCVRNDTALSKVSLFAYQSFIRAYNGYPRGIRQFFPADQLHLGHVATSFAIDETPSQVRRRLGSEKLVKGERTISRDATRFVKGGRVELEPEKDNYHSTLVSKQVKKTKDYSLEQKEKRQNVPKPLQFTEFDA